MTETNKDKTWLVKVPPEPAFWDSVKRHVLDFLQNVKCMVIVRFDNERR